MKGGLAVFDQITKKKAILDSKLPLNSEKLNTLKKYVDVDFTYNSNAIEGKYSYNYRNKGYFRGWINHWGKGKSLKRAFGSNKS